MYSGRQSTEGPALVNAHKRLLSAAGMLSNLQGACKISSHPQPSLFCLSSSAPSEEQLQGPLCSPGSRSSAPHRAGQPQATETNRHPNGSAERLTHVFHTLHLSPPFVLPSVPRGGFCVTDEEAEAQTLTHSDPEALM